MNWNTAIRTAYLGMLTGAALWGGLSLYPHLVRAVDAWGAAAPDTAATIAKTNTLLDFVSRPCASVDAKGHLLPDGPICELNQAIHDIRKITTASGKQVQQTGRLIDSTTATMTEAGDSVKKVADKLSETAVATAGLTTEFTKTVATVNGRIPGLMDHADATVGDLDAILKDNAIHQTLASTAGITANFDGVTFDFARVTHKAAEDYLTPKPWYRKVGRYAGDAVDYGAFIARHTP